MSDLTRRSLLRTGSAALSVLPAVAQAHHHEMVETPAAQPLPGQPPVSPFLQPHEFSSLQALCEIIIPADDHSAGARAAGAAEYIDLLARGNPQIAAIYHGGLAWLNSRSNTLYGAPFTGISEAQATSLVEQIADLDHAAPECKYGAIFFDWARRMTVDAFYTSPAGIRDLGYLGNKGMTVYRVPPEALEQALQRLGEKA
jgi:gluconate 2-dehydrogenase gamma chain